MIKGGRTSRCAHLFLCTLYSFSRPMWQYDVFTFAPNRAHHPGGGLPRVSPHSVRLALGYELPGPASPHLTNWELVENKWEIILSSRECVGSR